MRAQDSPQDGWVGAVAGLGGGSRQRRALRGWGGGAAGRKRRPSAREEKVGKGVEGRKEEATEGIEEQRHFHTGAKRRGDTFPDQEWLNPTGQRTGTVFTLQVQALSTCLAHLSLVSFLSLLETSHPLLTILTCKHSKSRLRSGTLYSSVIHFAADSRPCSVGSSSEALKHKARVRTSV
jgi:hypothetical protein